MNLSLVTAHAAAAAPATARDPYLSPATTLGNLSYKGPGSAPGGGFILYPHTFDQRRITVAATRAEAIDMAVDRSRASDTGQSYAVVVDDEPGFLVVPVAIGSPMWTGDGVRGEETFRALPIDGPGVAQLGVTLRGLAVADGPSIQAIVGTRTLFDFSAGVVARQSPLPDSDGT